MDRTHQIWTDAGLAEILAGSGVTELGIGRTTVQPSLSVAMGTFLSTLGGSCSRVASDSGFCEARHLPGHPASVFAPRLLAGGD